MGAVRDGCTWQCSSTESALGLLSLWNKSRVAWRLLITAIARYPLVSLAEGRPG